MRISVIARMGVALLWLATAAIPQSVLSVQGEPYFGGDITISVVDEVNVGELVWLAVGINPLPLDAPVSTGKGPWYIGLLTQTLLLGSIPADGEFGLSVTMPAEMPAVVGIPIVLQGFVDGALSNPATVSLDQPYLLPSTSQVVPSPEPSQGANFGDRLALGDLDGDGAVDLAVGAWFEDYLGVEKSGRVYVLWGPSFSSHTALSPNPPNALGFFGASVTIADLDGDSQPDLLVGESSAHPAVPSGTAYLHIFSGGASFQATPSLSIPSLGVGLLYSNYGRRLTLGDFNDDGATDIAVAAELETVSGIETAGRVDVFWGPLFSTHLQIPNPEPGAGDYFGSYLDTADLNGDGIDDLVEGSGRDDVGGIQNAGSIHTFLGPSLAHDSTIVSPQSASPGDRFGEDVHAVDLDGDSKADLIAADDLDRIFIFWSAQPGTYLTLNKPPSPIDNPFGDTGFGGRLGSGDANGDGLVDVVIADHFEGVLVGCAAGNSGTLYSALGPYYATFLVLADKQPSCADQFSFFFATSDLDGDSRPDFAVGAAVADDGGITNSGHVSVFINQ